MGGYRVSPEKLLDEYIDESGAKLTQDPRIVYDTKGIKSYLLETEDYYISLSLERSSLLWRFPKREVSSYSQNYSQVAGPLIIRPKNRDGESQDSFFIYYPTMFEYNQQTIDIEVEIVYMSESSKNTAYIYKDGSYEQKPLIPLEDSIYRLNSIMPSYIRNDTSIKSVFTNFNIFKYNENVNLEVCYEGKCTAESIVDESVNKYLELYDPRTYRNQESNIINTFKLEEADLSVELMDEDDYLSEKANKIYYFPQEKLVYALIPNLYETTHYDDGSETTLWEDALYVLPLDFYKNFPILQQ